MRLCFIGSGIERENTRLQGLEIQAVVGALRSHYDQLVFGGSSVGLMEAFASAFLAAGGSVTSVIPGWLEGEGLAFQGGDSIRCDDLAERKHLMFDGIDGVICYPGGIGTYDELFDLLASRATEGPGTSCPPIYLYNWEKFYAPLLLPRRRRLWRSASSTAKRSRRFFHSNPSRACARSSNGKLKVVDGLEGLRTSGVLWSPIPPGRSRTRPGCMPAATRHA